MNNAETPTPEIVIVAGPNGAGKSTIAPYLLKDALHIVEFVNADTIARGLCEFAPETVAFAAGRIMLTRIKDLASSRRSFAFETTLATRSFAPLCRRWIADGYKVSIVFLWLPSADAAVARVQTRVKMGGHSVEPAVIRRRYGRGLRNFFELYQPVADAWRFYNNASENGPTMIASSSQVTDTPLWNRITGEYRDTT